MNYYSTQNNAFHAINPEYRVPFMTFGNDAGTEIFYINENLLVSLVFTLKNFF